MTDYETFRKKLLSDPEVLKEYEAHKAEFEIAMALIKARLAAKMTQLDVARRMHTSQAQIARLESGQHFPSMSSIHKYAQAVNRKINLSINP
ncbi:MAG: helix-turn-helix domain-containing protein [Candidatus Paracaedibacter sp.]